MPACLIEVLGEAKLALRKIALQQRQQMLVCVKIQTCGPARPDRYQHGGGEGHHAGICHDL